MDNYKTSEYLELSLSEMTKVLKKAEKSKKLAGIKVEPIYRHDVILGVGHKDYMVYNVQVAEWED